MNATEQDKILPSSMLVREHIEANLSAFEIQHENGLHGREFLEVFGNSGHYTYPVIKERKEYCYLCEENAADELNAQVLEDFASCAEPAFPALRTDGRANPISPAYDPFFVADDQPAQREQEDHLTVGQAVICNGYDGTVREIHTGQLAGMADVYMTRARGTVCVSISELLRFNREECRAK